MNQPRTNTATYHQPITKQLHHNHPKLVNGHQSTTDHCTDLVYQLEPCPQGIRISHG